MKIHTSNLTPLLDKGQPVEYIQHGAVVYGELLEPVYLIDGYPVKVKVSFSTSSRVDKMLVKDKPSLIANDGLTTVSIENYERLKQILIKPMTPDECFSTSQQP